MADELEFQPNRAFRSAGFASSFVSINREVGTLQIRQSAIAKVVLQPSVDAAGFLILVPLDYQRSI